MRLILSSLLVGCCMAALSTNKSPTGNKVAWSFMKGWTRGLYCMMPHSYIVASQQPIR